MRADLEMLGEALALRVYRFVRLPIAFEDVDDALKLPEEETLKLGYEVIVNWGFVGVVFNDAESVDDAESVALGEAVRYDVFVVVPVDDDVGDIKDDAEEDPLDVSEETEVLVMSDDVLDENEEEEVPVEIAEFDDVGDELVQAVVEIVAVTERVYVPREETLLVAVAVFERVPSLLFDCVWDALPLVQPVAVAHDVKLKILELLAVEELDVEALLELLVLPVDEEVGLMVLPKVAELLAVPVAVPVFRDDEVTDNDAIADVEEEKVSTADIEHGTDSVPTKFVAVAVPESASIVEVIELETVIVGEFVDSDDGVVDIESDAWYDMVAGFDGVIVVKILSDGSVECDDDDRRLKVPQIVAEGSGWAVPLIVYDADEHVLADGCNEVDIDAEGQGLDDKVMIGIVPETDRLCFELKVLVGEIVVNWVRVIVDEGLTELVDVEIEFDGIPLIVAGIRENVITDEGEMEGYVVNDGTFDNDPLGLSLIKLETLGLEVIVNSIDDDNCDDWVEICENEALFVDIKLCVEQSEVENTAEEEMDGIADAVTDTDAVSVLVAFDDIVFETEAVSVSVIIEVGVSETNELKDPFKDLVPRTKGVKVCNVDDELLSFGEAVFEIDAQSLATILRVALLENEAVALDSLETLCTLLDVLEESCVDEDVAECEGWGVDESNADILGLFVSDEHADVDDVTVILDVDEWHAVTDGLREDDGEEKEDDDTLTDPVETALTEADEVTLRVCVIVADVDGVRDIFDVDEWQLDTEGQFEVEGDKNEDADMLTDLVKTAEKETEDETLRLLVGDTDVDCDSVPLDDGEWQLDTEGQFEDEGEENEDGDALTDLVFITTEAVTVVVVLRVRVGETERECVGDVEEVVDWHFVTEGLPESVFVE